MHRRVVLILLLALSLLPAPARATDTVRRHDVWSFVRGGAQSVFDPVRRRWIVYGGTSPRDGGTLRMLDLEGPPVWQRINAGGAGPGSYAEDPVALYDSNHDRMLYFIPDNPKIYTLSLAPPYTWSSFTFGGWTPVRGMTGAYDAKRDRAVLYGGYTINPYQPAILETRAGTTILDFAANGIVGGTLGTAPTHRACAAAAWDPVGDRMILHGGFQQDLFSPTPVYDTYEMDYVAGVPVWKQLSPPGNAPSVTRFPAVFDTLYHRMIIPFRGVLDVADSARWVDPVPQSPAPLEQPDYVYIDRGPVGAYDPMQQRLLYGGGIVKDVHGSSFAVGGFQQFALGPVMGPTSRLPLGGDADFPVSFGGYDRAQHRFVGLAGGSPLTLSVDDTTWTPAGETATGFGADVHPFYDSGSNTLYAVSRSDLYVIQPGAGATWQHFALAGAAPVQFDRLGPSFVDPARNRIVVIGGHDASSASPEMWVLNLGPAPSWTRLADSTPLGTRFTAASIDVRRDRALFFGGRMMAGGTLADLWALDLATMQFSQPAATGIPPSARPEVGAAYDSTRDRLIVTGDSLSGSFALQFGASDANGTWIRNDAAGAVYPMPFTGAAAHDPVRNHLYLADATRVFDQALGPYTVPLDVMAPNPQQWTPATIMGLGFAVRHGVAGTHTYAWTLRSDRNWPFFPMTGQVTYRIPGLFPIGVQFAVPDTAAPGVDSLRFEIHDVANPAIADSVVAWISNAVPLPTWTLVHSGVTGKKVDLSWRISISLEGYLAQLERRLGGGPWFTLGQGAFAPDSTVSFVDTTGTPGQTYNYRAAFEIETGTWTRSDEVLVDIPAPPGPPVFDWGVAAVSPDSINLSWRLSRPVTGPVQIQRRPDQGAWTVLGNVTTDPDTTVRFVDRSHPPEGIYGYRAGFEDPSGWIWSHDVWVDTRGPSPQWSAGSVAVDGDTIRVEWRISKSPSGTAWIERRPLAGAWQTLGQVALDPDSMVRYVDVAGLSGGQIGYRAGVVVPSGWIWSDELSVDIPASDGPLVFAFAQSGALVVQGSPEVRFTTPNPGTVRLEAFDLTGRRVAMRTMEVGSPGQYSLRLDNGVILRSGVYFLRLSQGTASVRTRAVIFGGN